MAVTGPAAAAVEPEQGADHQVGPNRGQVGPWRGNAHGVQGQGPGFAHQPEDQRGVPLHGDGQGDERPLPFQRGGQGIGIELGPLGMVDGRDGEPPEPRVQEGLGRMDPGVGALRLQPCAAGAKFGPQGGLGVVLIVQEAFIAGGEPS
jgi:hypothetical protein